MLELRDILDYALVLLEPPPPEQEAFGGAGGEAAGIGSPGSNGDDLQVCVCARACVCVFSSHFLGRLCTFFGDVHLSVQVTTVGTLCFSPSDIAASSERVV